MTSAVVTYMKAKIVLLGSILARIIKPGSTSSATGYIQTRTATGLVANHCAASMAPEGNSRVA